MTTHLAPRRAAAVPVALVLVVALAVLAGVTGVTAVASWFGFGAGSAEVAALPTSPASYLGVYEKGPPASYQPVATFSRAVGQTPNLAGYYGGGGEPFKTAFARTVHEHDAVTLLQWDPTGASLAAIAAGRYDGY